MVAYSKFKYQVNDDPWKTIPTADFTTPAALQDLVRTRPDVDDDAELLYVQGDDNYPFDVLPALSKGDQRVRISKQCVQNFFLAGL